MVCPACSSTQHAFAFEKDGYTLDTCDTCASYFTNPMPTAAALDEFYQNYYKTGQYASKLESKIKRARRRISRLGKGAGKRFLDVGCNVGFAVEAARQLGYEAHGIDLDATAIATAQASFPGCGFRSLHVQELAQQGAAFDVVYCSEVVEHVTHADAFVRSLRACLKPGGRLYLTTPDVGHFTLPRGRDKLRQMSWFRPPEHLIYFTKSGLRSLLEQSGFTTVRILFNLKPTLKAIAS